MQKFWYFAVQTKFMPATQISNFPFVFKTDQTEHFPLEEAEEAIRQNLLRRDLIQEEHKSDVVITLCSPLPISEASYEKYDAKFK